MDIYFNQLISRENLIQKSVSKSKNFTSELDKLNEELATIEEELNNLSDELYELNCILDEIKLNEKLIKTKVENRNNALNKNMELITDIEFENYYKSNEVILKKMKNIYGNKILDKINKSQKMKLMETIIADHTYKKNKVNEFIQLISKFEESQNFYLTNIRSLENAYLNVCEININTLII